MENKEKCQIEKTEKTQAPDGRTMKVISLSVKGDSLEEVKKKFDEIW